MTGKICCLALALFAPAIAALAAAPGMQPLSNERFRLIHADKLFLSNLDQENVLELFGNVHFFYGQTEFFSNRAMIYDTQKIARLIGSVRVSNDTLMVTADSIAYYRIPNLLNMGGNVVITEQKDKDRVFNRITCDRGSYDKANEVITSAGRVTGYSETEKARAKCNFAYWDRKNGYGYLIEQPELWSEGQDTLYVRSEKMEFFDTDHRIIATFNVLAKSKDYSATSDFLLYFLNEDKAIFQGKPNFSSDYADASATEFHLYFSERKLNRAELKDSCLVWFAQEKGNAKTNWVKAKYIAMEIENDYLQEFEAESEVTYFYNQAKQEDKDMFSNDASGDFLSAHFQKDGRLATLSMKNRVKGIYRFENNP